MSQVYQYNGIKQRAPRKTRSYPLSVIAVATLVIIAASVLLYKLREQPVLPAAQAEPSGKIGDESVSTLTVEDSGPKVYSRLNVAPKPSRNVPENIGDASGTPAPPLGSAQAQGILSRVVQSAANIRISTAQGANEWKQALQQLVGQGQAALPAIRDFLVKNQDISFDGAANREALGFPTLRAGLVDAIAQIGGSSALALLTDTLRDAADPNDIAALARALETQAPGQFRQQAIDAARETLQQVAAGNLSVTDVGPLFQVLEKYGDANIASDIATVSSKWPYYATMALAQLPEGTGIPTLVEQLQKPEVSGESRNLTLRMLSQLAAQYPDAAAALFEQARQNQIPDKAWRQIITGLAGDQFMLALDPNLKLSPTSTIEGLKTYHMQQGNQNFVSLPVGENAMISQRLDLINQLLNMTPSSFAMSELRKGRDTLMSYRPQP